MSAVGTTPQILPGQSYDAATTAAILEEFHREGYVVLRNVLTAGEVQLIRRTTDLWIDAPPEGRKAVVQNYRGTLVLRYTQSLDRLFCDMLVREPFLSLAEAVLGPDCGFVGQNVIRSGRDGAIAHWHVDDVLEFPLPESIPRHDPRMRMPITWFSFQIALSDLDGPEHGPTEVVPGSHYSGRNVPASETPDSPAGLVFEGRGPVPVLCKAGDVYLFNHQLWHRGSPNTSGRTRYLMQNQYSRRWCHGRFALPENKCGLPDEALRGAGERLMRMVGRG